MAVRLDLEAIVETWASWGQRETVMVAFTGAAHPRSVGRLEATARAIDEVNDVAESNWLDLDELPTTGRRLVEVGRGVAWEIDSQHPDGPVGWLSALAAVLTRGGWGGKITPYIPPDSGRLDTLASGERVACATVALAWGGSGLNHNGTARPVWLVDQRVIPALANLAWGFLSQQRGRNVVEHELMSQPEDAEMRTLLERALGNTKALSPFVWARRFGLQTNRAVTFDVRGHVLLTMCATRADLPGLALDACDYAATRSAQHCDWIALVENGMAHGWPDVYQDARGTLLPNYYERYRNRDADVVPDAFAWQLVGEEHLGRSHDLSGWSLDPLPATNGKYLLQTTSVDDWFVVNAADPVRVQVRPGVLESAREDFGAMILSD